MSDSETIDKYINHQMSEQEHSCFLQRVANSKSCRDELAFTLHLKKDICSLLTEVPIQVRKNAFGKIDGKTNITMDECILFTKNAVRLALQIL